MHFLLCLPLAHKQIIVNLLYKFFLENKTVISFVLINVAIFKRCRVLVIFVTIRETFFQFSETPFILRAQKMCFTKLNRKPSLSVSALNTEQEIFQDEVGNKFLWY